MTPPGRHVALGVALVLLGGPAVVARAVDPAPDDGARDVRSDAWVFDGTAFPRPGRLDLAAGSSRSSSGRATRSGSRSTPGTRSTCR